MHQTDVMTNWVPFDEARLIDEEAARYGVSSESLRAHLRALSREDSDGIGRAFKVNWVDDDQPLRVDGRIVMGYQVPKTRVFINLGTFKDLWIDAAIAIAAAMTTDTSGASAAIRAAVKSVQALRLLSEDEAEVVHVLLSLSGKSAYSEPFSEDVLRRSFVDATYSISDLLDSLEKKKIIVREPAGIRLKY